MINDFLTGDYQDLYQHLSGIVISQEYLQYFLQSVKPDVKITKISLNGSPKVSYSIGIPLMARPVSVTYTKNGTINSFNTSCIYEYENDQWMFMGSATR